MPLLSTRATVLACLVLLLCLSSSTAPAAASSPAAPSAGSTSVRKPTAGLAGFQGRRIERADITLNSYPSRDGSVHVEARGGDLQFHKNIRGNGSYSLTLEAPHDRVVVAFDEHTITVSRDRKTVTLNLGTATDDEFDKAHKLLADSRAARLMRQAAANIQDSQDDSPEAASFVLADAVVGMLTGDTAAPIRAARHLTRHIGGRLKPAGMQVDCYTTWESRTYEAYDEFSSCLASFEVWDPTQYLCAARWIIQAESYWFSFITCSGFSQF